MRMGIGLGVGINRSNYAQGIFNAYSARVVADGGVVESGTCVDAVSSLLQSASLLLIPSGYKGGKLYAEIPTNGNGDLTWTRGGDAFRTNASGVIQRVPWNLFQRSEEFDNAAWTKTNITLSTNATNAPNGTLTAEKAIQATGLSEHYLRQQVNSLTGVYTASIYAKKAELDFLILWEDVTTGKRACFNLSNGTIGLTSNSPNATITNVGDGWYRCTIEATLSSQGFGLYVAPSQTNTVLGVSQTGNGTSGVLIWGAQLVEGTTAQTYLPTTDRLNFPRLSYMYGSCPSALLEPQRTNTLLYSNDFTNASWVKDNSGATNPVVTANYATSPDGSNNASRLQLNKTGGVFSRIYQYASAGAGTYSFTVYMKSNTGSSQNVGLRLESVGINCVVTTSWQRFTLNSTVTTAQAQIMLYDLISGNDETADILIYGAQLEAGAYPTTYIPTTSATATRVADSFSRSNIYTNGLISASGGTWFVELRNNIAYTRDAVQSNSIMLDTATGGLTNGFTFIGNAATVRLRLQKWVSGTGTVLYLTSADTVKIAIKWNGSTADIFENGVKVVSATSFTATAMEFLNATTLDCPKFIQQMALFNTPLTDTQCQTLTT